MSRALNATGRPILYSMCNWGEDGPWNFATVCKSSAICDPIIQPCFRQTMANSWRISGDIMDVRVLSGKGGASRSNVARCIG